MAIHKSIVADICESTQVDVSIIKKNTRGELLGGVAEVIESIRLEQPEGSPELETLDSMAMAVRYSAGQIDIILDLLADIFKTAGVAQKFKDDIADVIYKGHLMR